MLSQDSGIEQVKMSIPARRVGFAAATVLLVALSLDAAVEEFGAVQASNGPMSALFGAVYAAILAREIWAIDSRAHGRAGTGGEFAWVWFECVAPPLFLVSPFVRLLRAVRGPGRPLFTVVLAAWWLSWIGVWATLIADVANSSLVLAVDASLNVVICVSAVLGFACVCLGAASTRTRV